VQVAEARPPDIDREIAWDRVAVLAIALGVVLRAVFVLVLHPPSHYVYSDMSGYVSRAVMVLAGGGVHRELALWPPGTHLLLAGVFSLFGTGDRGLWAANVLWFAISAATPVLAWRLARVLVSSRPAAIAAGLCAIYPLFIFYAGYSHLRRRRSRFCAPCSGSATARRDLSARLVSRSVSAAVFSAGRWWQYGHNLS